MEDRNVVNEAVEQLTRTIASSYKTLMDNTIALQERNVWFALALFGGPANAYAVAVRGVRGPRERRKWQPTDTGLR